MANIQTRPWTRPHDWISVLAGAYLALSPLWVEVGTGGRWAMVVIGAVIAVLAVIALAAPGAVIDEWAMTAGGVVAFIAPWLFSYSDLAAAAWGSWLVGAVVVVASLFAVPASREVYQRQHHTV